MKKLFLITVILIFSYAEIMAQCTNCYGETNTGTNSSAIGTETVSKGHSSFSSGFKSEATQNYTTALGFYSFATYSGATAIGSTVKATMHNSFVIGAGGPWNENIYLVNNIERSLMIGFSSIYPTLFVSESPQSAYYDKTGRIGIGNVTAPQAKLHIRADDGEEAAILIEPNTWGTGAQAHLLLGSPENGISVEKQVEGTDLLFRSERNYLFNSMGYVGINTLDPLYNLHVEGSMFAKSFRLYNDALPPLEEGFVLVADELGNAYWGNPATFSLWQLNGNGSDIYYNEGKVGIGIENPEEMLDVAGNILVNDAIIGKVASGRWNDPFYLTLKGSKNEFASKIMLCKGDLGVNQNQIKIINPMLDGGVQFHVGGKINFGIKTNETVLGAHSGTDYALKVNGKIWTNEVEVLVQVWWDEVFDKDYPLMSLTDLDNYIQQNQHLPGIPVEEEVLENGIKLGEMNALLLKKIEELTLYTIEQQKMMEKQLKMIENHQQQINELKQLVND